MEMQVILYLIVYEWLKLYLIARNQRSLKSDVVFVTWSGKSLTSGNISDRINTQWVRAGIWKSDMRLNTNLIRKSTTTDLLDRGSIYAKDAACLMMHSEKTAKEHYQLVQKKQSMHRGSKAISGLYFPDGVVSSEVAKTTMADHLEDVVKPLSPCSTPRKIWNKLEVDILTSIPGSPDVICKSPEVQKLNATRRQIYDKLRSLKESPLKRERKISTCSRSSALSPPKIFGKKTNRVSKWSVEQQEIFVHSGILEMKRLTSEEIRTILPGSITDCFSDSQICTRLAYEKSKLKSVGKT